MKQTRENRNILLRNSTITRKERAGKQAVAGPHASKVQASPVYKFGINLPLVATYHFVRLQRTAPEFVWVSIAAALAVSVVLLAVDFLFRKDLFGNDPGWQRWLLVAGPAVVILLVLSLLYLFHKPIRPKPIKA